MVKLYEVYGIPENAWLEYNEPPDYAVIYEDNGNDDPFDQPYGLIPWNLRLWGGADYWTPLEAALLLAGVSPDDDQLYAVSQQTVPDEGYGATYSAWKYSYKFDSARDYLFLFERSNLAPKAPPIEWVKYFNQKVRHTQSMPPFEPNYCDDWQKYFSAELSAFNQVDNPTQSSLDNPTRREQQHEIILAVIAALEFDAHKIPDGGKSKIKAACMTRPRIFTPDSFDHAWKAGLSSGLFKLANHDKYSSK
jgi:hypothetical protein